MTQLSVEQIHLLALLYDSHKRGMFAVSCDGSDRAIAHELDKLELARWNGTNWGSSFWSITDKGVALVGETLESGKR